MPGTRLVQQVQLDVGGTVETTFLGSRPTSVVATLYGPNAVAGGGPEQKQASAAASLESSVSTTLSEVALAGARSITVASATGIVAGQQLLIGVVGGTEPFEDVRVQSVSGSTINLVDKLVFKHASAAAVGATRCTLAVSAASADEVWGGGYVTFTPTGGTNLRPQSEQVDCVIAPLPELLCGVSDMRAVNSQMLEDMDPTTDWLNLLRDARNEMLMDLGPDRARFTIGTAIFARAAACKAFLLARHAMGKAHAEKIESIATEYQGLLERIRQQAPKDVDQDGVVNEAADDLAAPGALGISTTAGLADDADDPFARLLTHWDTE